MKRNVILLSLVTSAFLNISSSFAKNLKNLSTIKSNKSARFEIYPVKSSKTENKKSLEYKGNYLLPLSKKPALILENFDYSSYINEKAGIKLYIDDKNQKILTHIAKKYKNNRLAIVSNGNVLSAPQVKTIFKNDLIDLDFKNKDKFSELVDSLQG